MSAAPKHILLVLDDNPRATAEAFRLAAQYAARLTALFVMDATWNGYVGHDWLSGSGSRADFLDYVKEEEEKEAQAAVARFQAAADGLPDTECLIAAGDVLVQVKKEMGKGYDLVVMGNPLRRGLEMMRDSVAPICEEAGIRILLVP